MDPDLAAEIIHAAQERGVNFLDTADVYQRGRSELAIGRAIADRRNQFVIATKFFHPTEGGGPNDRGGSRHHILNAVEASLARLGTDYIDLYQIHRWDEDTPLEETLRTLEDLVRAGKVRYIGASNFTAWQLVQAQAVSELNRWGRFVSIQPHYHLLEREIERELIPACRYLGAGILPYFPLAGGFLTGKYRSGQAPPAGSRGEGSEYVQNYMTEVNFRILAGLTDFARARGHTLVELAHAWLLARPQVCSVISGATRVEHVLANTAASDWELSSEDLQEVEEVLAASDSST